MLFRSHMLANFIGVTGLETGSAPRTVHVRGEAPPSQDVVRISCDFAGRAIDIALRYIGPIFETAPAAGGADP